MKKLFLHKISNKAPVKLYTLLLCLLIPPLRVQSQDISGEWEGTGSNGVLYSISIGQTNTEVLGIIHAEYAAEKGNTMYYDGNFKGIFKNNKLMKEFDKITATNAATICQSRGVYTYRCDGEYEYLDAEMTPTLDFGNCQAFTIKYQRKAKEDCQQRACPIPTNITVKVLDLQATDFQTIDINWDAIKEAKSYTIYYKKEDDSSWQTQIVSSNSNSTRISQLTIDAKYEVKVVANCEKINSKPVLTHFTTPKVVPIEQQTNNIAQKLGRTVKITHKLTVKSDNLKIYIWDSGTLVDGDIISLYLNDKKVVDARILLRLKREYTIDLEEGTNIITSFAHNTGLVSPNTASIIIDDGFSQQKIELNCTMNESEAIQILKNKN